MATLASRLTFSDPRSGEMRYFEERKARRVSNHDKSVVIIDSEEYVVYSLGQNIAHILAAAADDEATIATWLSMDPRPNLKVFHKAIPAHWEVRAESRWIIHVRIPDLRANEFKSFFAQCAENGIWNVSSPRSENDILNFIESHKPGDFLGFLESAERWNWVFHIDIDGILLGFMRADSCFDRFLAKVQRIEV